uniref:glucan endo-1,3-beta-D-glucosidase n=1 Tax=Davidia involucrata TaxID=16924 RepID=A0A5B6ZK60_DAVIN
MLQKKEGGFKRFISRFRSPSPPPRPLLPPPLLPSPPPPSLPSLPSPPSPSSPSPPPPSPSPLPPSPLPTPPPSPLPTPPPSPPPTPPPRQPTYPFLFPKTQSIVLPDPSVFFSSHLLPSPLPTNSFFQNFVLNKGDQPEYIHPYLIKSSLSSLTLCYPSQFSNSDFINQIFKADLTISISNNTNPNSTHIISSYTDLSVTLDLPSSNLRFFLVRGSPFLTCAVTGGVLLSISTIHAIDQLSSNRSLTKHTIKLNNNQTWLLYSSSPVNLTHDISTITSDGFSGIIRIANLPNSDPQYKTILNRFSSCYPVSGDALFRKPYCLEYKWEKKGWGDLLMLAHPLHLRLLSTNDCKITVLEDFKYKSIDGELVGVVGDSWVLKTNPVSVTWHSIRGIKEESYPEIIDALRKDVEALNLTTISTSSSYSHGKLIARAARLALIAEEVSYPEIIPAINKYLKDTIEPWLDGTFDANGFLYDEKWGGIVTKQGSLDSGADFGFGIYNDHHYHLGYFIYAIAVHAKIDPAWGRKYRPQAYSLVADFMNLGRRANTNYPQLRCFDLWKLHSWAGGLTEFADGRNQESTSQAVSAYYSAALMGLAYGDTHLVAIGSTLSAMEIQSAQIWWHVREGDEMYAEDFTRENRMVGVLWANKRDRGLWFAPSDRRECRLGIQLLPLLPITEVLFSDVGFVKELVQWTLPALGREGVGEGWKGFMYALEAIYDKVGALDKIKNLNRFDDGNSLTNLLWWTHSRGDEEDQGKEWGGKFSWFGLYYY